MLRVPYPMGFYTKWTDGRIADAKDPEMNKGVNAGRRCIPPGFVARHLHTPGMRAPRASPGGRLDAQTWHLYSFPGPKAGWKGRTCSFSASAGFAVEAKSDADSAHQRVR